MPNRRMHYGKKFGSSKPYQHGPGVDGPAIKRAMIEKSRRMACERAERNATGAPSKVDIAMRAGASRRNRNVKITLAGPAFDD